MKIEQTKIEEFRALDTKEQKGALADYAQTFGVKLNKQKSFDNMLAELVASLPDEEPELLIDSPEPAIAIYPATVEYKGTVTMGESVINVPSIPDVEVTVGEPEFVEPAGFDKGKILDLADVVSQPLTPHQETAPILKASVSDSDEGKEESVCWDNFRPTINLMGRSASSNGYYTCPWWIYDWIKQNPEWYKDPDQCPHYSARDTLKSLVYYIKRDGQVTVRETRNSSFDTFKI